MASKMEQRKIREDLVGQHEAGAKAQAEKLAQSKGFLVGQLRMAGQKYLTVNGYMQARQTIEQVAFGEEDPGTFATDACRVAREMSELAEILADKVEAMDVMLIDESVLDGHLVTNFVELTGEPDPDFFLNTVRQLLVVNLLQNVGPSVDDIVQFRTMTNTELARIQQEILKYGAWTSKLDQIEPGTKQVEPPSGKPDTSGRRLRNVNK